MHQQDLSGRGRPGRNGLCEGHTAAFARGGLLVRDDCGVLYAPRLSHSRAPRQNLRKGEYLMENFDGEEFIKNIRAAYGEPSLGAAPFTGWEAPEDVSYAARRARAEREVAWATQKDREVARQRSVQINIRCEPELYDALKAMAQRAERSLSAEIRRVLKAHAGLAETRAYMRKAA